MAPRNNFMSGMAAAAEDDLLSVSSSSSYSGSRRSAENQVDEEKELRDKIIKKEERAVHHVRIVVVAAILICAVAVSVAIYIFAKKNDEYTFEIEFEGYVKNIISSVQWEVQYNFALMQQLSASITAHALTTNSSFPHVMLPEFEVVGGYADGMGGIMMAGFAPYVSSEQRQEWQEYSVKNQWWLEESKHLKVVHPGHRDALHGTVQDHEHDRRLEESSIPSISAEIYRWENGKRTPEDYEPDHVFAPLWQSSPADSAAVNVNLLSDKRIAGLVTAMTASEQSVLSAATEIGDMFDWMFDPEEKNRKVEPHGFLLEPLYEAFEEDAKQVGFLLGLTSFQNLFTRLLPQGVNGISCVVKDSCGNAMTFNLAGPEAIFLGSEDLHETSFNEFERTVPMEINYQESITDGLCVHQLYIYPTSSFRNSYDTNKPAIYTSVVVLAFFVTALLLLTYDILVSRRQEKTMQSAIRTNKFVSSLFPENVRDRLLEDEKPRAEEEKEIFLNGKKSRMTRNEMGQFEDKPIADFFPQTTVIFADIAGFTAWSSTREPFQVFMLLETIYGAFDEIARKRRVFKVETVGDCYVAVCGVPTPRKDHATAMCRFARDCLFKMHEVTQNLEVALGPDTAELTFRIGLHSGPVTGGVLRGEGCRFQLFGDTMNTAARMESTGLPDSVHISAATASLLSASGRDHWLKKRVEAVYAKGKGGEMETFWLNLEPEATKSTGSRSSQSLDSSSNDPRKKPRELLDAKSNVRGRNDSLKYMRLVDWNVSVLLQRLKALAKQRSLGEEDADISEAASKQLKLYVTGIATMYRKNSFHNFEHASHVTMSVTKMLSRVIGCDEQSATPSGYIKDIASEALTQLAIVFSSLVHDVDHTGVSNAQLVSEKSPVALRYKNESVAENNSLTLAWKFLMRPEFEQLVDFICPTRADKERFHNVMTSAILATDVFDKKLIQQRNEKWAHVFGSEQATTATEEELNHLKASIVLDHLIQTSDIAHTMQHWHVYSKWNERLFCEMWDAFKNGRAAKDPREFWYKGELGFYDHYVIPLAKKLEECKVFGVSSDEFLSYALANRQEWELKGEELVENLSRKYCETSQDLESKVNKDDAMGQLKVEPAQRFM